MMGRAVITGIAGQDGSYLADLLLARGYEVHGLVRESRLADPQSLWRIAPVRSQLTLHGSPLEEPSEVASFLQRVRPTELYHLASHTTVNCLPEADVAVFKNDLSATLHVLAAVRAHVPDCRVCFAGSSEIFGNADVSPQTESARARPRSIYGIAKLGGLELVRFYREKHGLFASTAILYNHESPRRGAGFVSRKVSLGVAAILSGSSRQLPLGNLAAIRDWGYAPDYVDAMCRIVGEREPGDFVIGTGIGHTVQDLVQTAFDHVGLDWQDYVSVDPSLVRTEGEQPLIADASEAKLRLGWQAQTGFRETIRQMVEADCARSGVAIGNGALLAHPNRE